MTVSNNLSAIEKAMEGVTPGPWIRQDLGHGSRVSPDIAWCGNTSSKSPAETASNADYIAACSPDRMREVLAFVRAMERENAALKEALRAFADISDLVDAETEGFSDDDTFDLMFHDYLLDRLPLHDFRRARALLGGSDAGN